MKSNTQTLLYIIVIIASLFFSLIKKKKKTSKTVSGTQKKQFSSSILSTLLGNNFDMEEPQSDEDYIETEPVEIKKSEKKKINIDRDIIKKAHKEEGENEDFNVLEDFDLPQAIVYSEILKKKEF